MRVVICCDQQPPAEMLRDSVTIAKALLERGHSVSFIVGDPVSLVEAAGSWVPDDIYEAPARRAPPNAIKKSPIVDGFADVMAVFGFDDKATLIVLASLWHRQLLALKPDVIVGFYTPVLWLVGPSVAPTFALGSGLMLPPLSGTSFPRLSSDSTPLADEKIMTANANAALKRIGQKPLVSLSEVLGRCTSILYGVPAFDPYLQLRRTPSAGLLGEEPKPTVPPPKERLAAFLDIYCPDIEQILFAISGVENIPIDVCVSGATSGIRQFLAQQPNIKLWTDYASLLACAANATALVHHGVQDVGQRCISLGRPQLLIPWTYEQEMFLKSVGWMDFTWVKRPGTSLQEMIGTLAAIPHQVSIAVAAQHRARELANTKLPDALPTIIQRVELAADVAESRRW
jgi:hypothetical protein